MGMTHQDWTRAFKTRAKGKAFKAIDKFLRLYQEENGDFRIERWVGGWTGGEQGRIYTAFATATKYDICTFLADPNSGDNQGKNLACKVAGFGNVYTSNKFAMYEHKLRFVAFGINVPFTTGLALDTRNHKVVHSVPDVKNKTNRSKSKPVYEFTDRVVRMMELLIRIDGFTNKDNPPHWRDRYKALAEAKSLTMEEENIVEIAELAYKEASVRTSVPLSRYWVYNNGRGFYVDRSTDEVRALYNASVLRLARRRLHAELKHRNGCYTKEVVN